MLSGGQQGRARERGGYSGHSGERKWDSAQGGTGDRGHPREGRQGDPGVENLIWGERELLCHKLPLYKLNKSGGCGGGVLCELLTDGSGGRISACFLLQNEAGPFCKPLNGSSCGSVGIRCPPRLHQGGLGLKREEVVWKVGVCQG